MRQLTRAERRRQERSDKKIINKTYTFKEMSKIVATALKNQEKEYDMIYAVTMATTLAAPPLNFRHKRVCRFVHDFFEQLDAAQNKRVDLLELQIEAAKVGVLLKDRGEGLEVYIDPKYKYTKGDV